MEHELARRERLDYFGLWDACYKLVSIRGLKGMYAEVSDHRYSYSMGIGHAWSVKVPYDSLAPLAERPYTRDTEQTKHSHPEQYRQHWKGGTAYNYGMYGVNYPVPATRNSQQGPRLAVTKPCLWLTWLSYHHRRV